MSSRLAKFRFHLALYAAVLGRRPPFREISKEPFAGDESFFPKQDIFFWTPDATAGAQVIVHDMLPSLVQQARDLNLKWNIEAGPRLPARAVDWLVCFKAVPPVAGVAGSPKQVLLICDQAEVFWDKLPLFGGVVATSSRPFATLLAGRHSRVAFISEAEPVEYLEFGRQNLATAPARRGPVLMWHGGAYSQDALLALRPALQRLAQEQSVELHVICGSKEARTEDWDRLKVRFLPWSKEQLRRSAAAARLGIVPARRSVKSSWLKPASRTRCLYALGVPAVGDDRVPDVVEFMTGFSGPLAGRSRAWEDCLRGVWNDESALARFAVAGHAAVANGYSTQHSARQWVRYFANRLV